MFRARRPAARRSLTFSSAYFPARSIDASRWRNVSISESSATAGSAAGTAVIAFFLKDVLQGGVLEKIRDHITDPAEKILESRRGFERTGLVEVPAHTSHRGQRAVHRAHDLGDRDVLGLPSQGESAVGTAAGVNQP